MSMAPQLPKNAPFAPDEAELINRVVARTTQQQRAWLAGYFAGLEAASVQAPPAAPARPRYFARPASR